MPSTVVGPHRSAVLGAGESHQADDQGDRPEHGRDHDPGPPHGRDSSNVRRGCRFACRRRAVVTDSGTDDEPKERACTGRRPRRRQRRRRGGAYRRGPFSSLRPSARSWRSSTRPSSTSPSRTSASRSPTRRSRRCPGSSTPTASSSRRSSSCPAGWPTWWVGDGPSPTASSLFTIASVLCAIAPSVEVLIAFRLLQALGAALLVPASLALVVEAFPAEKRSHAVGLWGAAAALAAGLGPPIGGALVEWGDWRWAFLVNLPFGLAALWAGRRMLVESRAPGHRRLPDLLGATVSALMLGALTLGIVKGGDWGWTSPATIACFVASAVLLVGVRRQLASASIAAGRSRPAAHPAVRRRATSRPSSPGSASTRTC